MVQKTIPTLNLLAFDEEQPFLLQQDKLGITKKIPQLLSMQPDSKAIEAGINAMLGSVSLVAEVYEVEAYKPYIRAGQSVVVPITGILLNNCSTCCPSLYTGYDYIRSVLSRAQSDSEVKSIVFLIDSFGGMAQGCMELGSFIREVRENIPIVAFVKDNACSAAYAMASSASRIIASPSADVGSIGAVSVHRDYSRQLDSEGITVTHISAPAGGNKFETSPYVKLSEGAKQRWQERIDTVYDLFVQCVHEGRGLSREAIIGTQANIYDSYKAKELGLIDDVSLIDEALGDFIKTPIEDNNEGNVDMKDNAQKTEAASQGQETASTPAAQTLKTFDDGFKEGYAAAATAEHNRIKEILSSDEGKTHPVSAMSLALNTSMNSTDTINLLRTFPAETAEKSSASATPAAPAEAAALAVSTEGDAKDGLTLNVGGQSVKLPKGVTAASLFAAATKAATPPVASEDSVKAETAGRGEEAKKEVSQITALAEKIGVKF